jgi:pimeloyl-ACP methyl ester carboxylesterase
VRGVGKNAAQADREAFLTTMGVERILADGEAVIEHLCRTLRKDRVSLLGCSWGAMVGVKLAELLTQRVSVYAGVGQSIRPASSP